MKISEPTPSHLLLFPGLSQWKITVCSLYYSSMEPFSQMDILSGTPSTVLYRPIYINQNPK